MSLLQFVLMLGTALLGGGGIAGVLTVINNRKLTKAQAELAKSQAGGAEAESEQTDQKTRTLTMQDAHDQLAASKRVGDECNRRLSRLDEATWNFLEVVQGEHDAVGRLIDVLQRVVVPELSSRLAAEALVAAVSEVRDSRVRHRDVTGALRQALFDRPAPAP